MPLLEEIKLAAQDCFDRAAQRLAAASLPPPPLEPILRTRQELARLPPQPARLVALRAAASPLFEAAKPLLEALARMPAQIDPTRTEVLNRWLLGEVASFQAVCKEACIRTEYIVGASYVLCTALDESVSDSLLGKEGAQPGAANPWMDRSLAVHFHGDREGGSKVFRLVGRLVIEPQAHIDLLELVFAVITLGFEGVYRHGANGRRELDNMRHQIRSLVSNCRKNGTAEVFAHWQFVERFIHNPVAYFAGA